MQTKQRITPDPSQDAAAKRAVVDSTNVVAGAGTGKTSVLVARYLTLVERDGIPFDRLLALTFTLKAAAEMRDRIRAEVTRRLPGQAHLLFGAWIQNFHQFGFRFIKENAPALGIDPGVDVISPAEFERMERWMRARFEAGRIPGVAPDFGGEPPIPTELPTLFDTLMKIVHKCRGNMIDPVDMRALCHERDFPAYVARVDAVVALAGEWEAELRRRNLVDFSDMISIPARSLIGDSAIAARYRGAFDHILVDEFQDTSRAQNEMLRALSGGDFTRVTVVGDVKQAIYRWRDARTENVTEFPAEQRPLTVNYRSRQNILKLAQALAESTPGLEGFRPELTASRGEGTHPVLMFHPPGEKTSYELEASALADWVQYLLGRADAPANWNLPALEAPLTPPDIAILLRSFRNSRTRSAIEAEFRRRGIPFALIGGADGSESITLESWHEMLSLLLPGPRVVNLLAVLEARPFAISEASLHQLLTKAPKSATTAELLAEDRVQRINDERDAAVVRSLRDAVAILADAHARLGFREFLAWAIERTWLRFELADAGVTTTATDDLIRELLELGDTLSRHGAVSLASFLDHLDATLDEGRFREEGDVRLPDDRIAMMTIHQAKGLEFPAVAVVGISPPRTNSDEHFTVSPEAGIFFSKKTAERWFRERDRAPEYEHEKEQEKLEERCILYVALTRARDHLWVSTPFADGISRGKQERPTLFAELVEIACAKSLAAELRSANDPADATLGAEAERKRDQQAELLLRDWVGLRTTAEERELDDRTAPRSVEIVTWAALARYDMCPLAFLFDRERRYATMREESALEETSGDFPDINLPKGVDPAEFGAFVHAVLERRDDLGDDLDASIGRVALRYDFGKHLSTVTDLARARIAGACAAGLAGASDGARSELPFQVRAGNIMVHGVIDRLDTLKDGALVTDYKLGVPHESHHFQVAVYAWATQRALHERNTQARLVYLGHDPIRTDPVANDDARIDGLVAAMGKSFETEKFEAKPGEVCASCEHRSHCTFAVRD
jgi:DNA helicase-2/ATP-dependent DNA helicase PcrA